ncbi:hypothetical protein I302_101375 [Kwoniella bestiolae CBS 10118]|uniref:Uncharacterized protein n=1 Tax=Kwoniella bestiolae CBS 10118 TaxID=1296100 RepID=A0A1B9GC26_9TREE|nr:hypothetical protein I302_00058 [Kwoniella bestiolae CBS 10118]OCF28570.1 hypothetical protein I302_00058 [Kwoniella bestiolae CBS 10118]
MARSMMDIEDELSRLWGLVGELSDQLAHNRALVTQLKSRSDNVKGQAAHVGTGFPLRRFNLDISNEEFQSELEAFSSHLVTENQGLQHENKQLNALLKEYEQTLETVMGKFRGVAHSSQQHDLSLHSYYTSLLQTLQTAHSSAQLHDSTSLSLLLTRLSTLLRSALRSMGGEDSDNDLANLPGLLNLVSHPATISEISSSPKSTTSNLKPFPKAPTKPSHFPGFIPGQSGGYNGTEGQSDWALEREMEILRLEEENKSLRELLNISQDLKIPSVSAEEVIEEEEKEGVKSPEGERSRKSSLTIEELEAGAALEADQLAESNKIRDSTQQHQQEHDEMEKNHQEHVESDQPPTTPQEIRESVLGFETTERPPEEAIVDEPDAEAMDPNGE